MSVTCAQLKFLNVNCNIAFPDFRLVMSTLVLLCVVGTMYNVWFYKPDKHIHCISQSMKPILNNAEGDKDEIDLSETTHKPSISKDASQNVLSGMLQLTVKKLQYVNFMKYWQFFEYLIEIKRNILSSIKS